MPKALLSKVAKLLTKKKTLNSARTTTAAASVSASAKPTRVLTDNGNAKKLKATTTSGARKHATAVVPAKTRSGLSVSVKGSNVENRATASAARMKEKPKASPRAKEEKGGRAKSRDAVSAKKIAAAGVNATAAAAKKEARKKTDAHKSGIVAEKSEIAKSFANAAASAPSPPACKKDAKRRGKDQSEAADSRKSSKSAKKTEDSVAGCVDPVAKNVAQKSGGNADDGCGQRKDPKTAKCDDNEPKRLDERCMAPKKRIKHKCAKESMAGVAAAAEEKDAPVDLSASGTAAPPPATGPQDGKKAPNIKFFKSKSKKVEKAKETPASAKGKEGGDLKNAFAVYDNIDADIEETSRSVKRRNHAAFPPAITKNRVQKIGKETEIKMKQHLEAFKRSKLSKSKAKAAGDERTEKRKGDSDSELESAVKCKKLKRNVPEEEEGEVAEVAPPPPKEVKANKKKPSNKATEVKSAKVEDGSLSSSSSSSSHLSDSAPLNSLISVKKSKHESSGSDHKNASAKPSVKQEAQSDDVEAVDGDVKRFESKCPAKKAKSSKVASKGDKAASNDDDDDAKPQQPASSNSKKATPPKKSVRFNKQVVSKAIAKPVRRRRQRMASLNALAMVHCMYENEGKSISVSSFDSTEQSDDHAVAAKPAKKTSSTTTTTTTTPQSAKPEAVDVELKEMALVKFEPHGYDVDPVIKRESLRTAPGLRSVGKHWDMNSSSISSTLSDETVEVVPVVAAAPPIVIEEIVGAEKPPKSALRKKFARALRRHVSEDSSEEDKHQALLLEEKQRMMRRRRRQKKEMTMDLKDMVVCKRMASLNATAILAASYSSASGKRTITVKSAGSKSEEKRENVVETKAKVRGKLPYIRKKFSSSSDADVEDEADMSGNEVVLKTASSSGKQQVSLIVNQDSGVTITGLYLNSTTKSTHHQGYCSISGMQYRISSTSHTQTEATSLTTEAIVRTPQEPLRPPITVSMHPDRQLSPPHNVALSTNHPSPVKTYTPLGALSSMQPPGSPHHMHHLHHHPKTVTISSTQEISSLERHGCPSAFSAPTVYGPPPPPPLASVPARPPYPILSKTPPEPGFVAGYYQPAGPLISHHHHHHHHHHHVQTNSTTTTSTAGAPATTATSASSSASTISFAKVSQQSPLVHPPTPPASSVTQPVSETSDNEMGSATTPAAEIAASESANDEFNYPMNYRFGATTTNPPFRSPSHNYQSYYPSPPSTASLTHPPQQTHFQEILYSANPPPPPPGSAGPYHLGYLQSKGPPYHPPMQRRYIPALPPQQYFHPEYPSSAPASQQQVVVPAHPLTATSDSYHSAPPTPSIIESYPPPPPPLYYSGYSSAPPTPYYPYATSSRSLTLVETSCPCPLQGCQKNVDTGPLTGFISKGPVEQRNTPLSPVALLLPTEPQDIRSLPSPARGSAGSRPTPSPAIATARNPSSWNESSDCGYDTAGLLTISKGGAAAGVDSGGDRDSGIDGTEIADAQTRRKHVRHEAKRMKLMRKTRMDKQRAKYCCRVNGAATVSEMRPSFYDDVADSTVGLMAAGGPVTGFVSRVKPAMLDVCDNVDVCDNLEERIDELVTRKRSNCKRWCAAVAAAAGDDCHSDEREMPKLYPEVDIGYESRRPCAGARKDEPPPPKRSKTTDSSSLSSSLPLPDPHDGPINVEKNNLLSALQLCSVSDLEHLCEPAKTPTMTLTAMADSLAPPRRHDETRVMISSKRRAEARAAAELSSNPKSADAETRSEPPTSAAPGECSPADVPATCCRMTNVEARRPRLRRRRWTPRKRNKKKANKSVKSSEEEKIEAEKAEKRRRAELLSLTQKRAASRLKWSNGWMWLGEPFVTRVFLNTEGPEVLRTCYHAMKHQGGDIIRPKDCILLRSGSKKTDLPYVAKVAHLWEDPEDGEMMMSLFWYYRPEHTDHDAINSESPYELYASKHKDVNSVACIEDKCYVLTFNEYCRYHKSIRQTEESVDISSVIVPPLAKKRYPRQALLPPENTQLDLVFFCRKIYDFRQHRLLKNPFFV